MTTAKQKSIRSLSDMDLEYSYTKSIIRKPSDAAAYRHEMERRKKGVRLKRNPIQNPNSSGQGFDADYMNNPYAEFLLDNGYEYSHSTPIRKRDGSHYTHDTFRNVKNHDAVVGSARSGGTWDAHMLGSGRRKTGLGLAALQKYIRSRSRRIPLKKNPTSHIRRPAQTRRRSGFPGYIVTFIRPGAMKLKRQYIGGGRRAYTVVYKRFAAAVFSTSDKAKNVVRTYRKWFEANGVSKVTILRTNEAASKFP